MVRAPRSSSRPARPSRAFAALLIALLLIPGNLLAPPALARGTAQAGPIRWIPVQISPASDPAGPPGPGGQDVIRRRVGSHPLPGGVGVGGGPAVDLAAPNLVGLNYPPDGVDFHVTPETGVHWGDSISVYFAVLNNGTADIPAGDAYAYYVGFFLSPDADISTGDSPWVLYYDNLGLRYGYYYTDSFSYVLPTSPPPGLPASGTFYIGMYLDCTFAITELSETDNHNQGDHIDRHSVTLFGQPDLVAATPKPSAAPPYGVGQSVTWVVTTTNQGNAAALATQLGYYLETSCTLHSNLVGTDSVAALAAGASQQDSFTRAFVAGDVGEKYLVAFADHLNAEQNESDENNNCGCYGPFQVLPTYSLVTATAPPGTGTVSVSPPPNAEGGKYLAGTVVQLTANHAPGYMLHHWSGDASGANSTIDVTMDGDKTITANFVVATSTFLPFVLRQ